MFLLDMIQTEHIFINPIIHSDKQHSDNKYILSQISAFVTQ